MFKHPYHQIAYAIALFIIAVPGCPDSTRTTHTPSIIRTQPTVDTSICSDETMPAVNRETGHGPASSCRASQSFGCLEE